MKGIVFRKIGAKYLVMTEDGNYVKVRLRGEPRPGCEYELPARKQARFPVAIPVLASILVLVFAAGVYAYTTPVSFVTVDINPSVELSLNRIEYVIKAKALNNEAEDLLKHGEILNRPLRSALDNLVSQAQVEGYTLTDAEGSVLLTVFSGNEDRNEKIMKLFEESQDEFNEAGKGIGLIIAASNLERLEEAKEIGISPGKLNLISKIELEEDIDLDPFVYKDLSVREIMALAKENGIDNKESQGNNKNKDDKGKSSGNAVEKEPGPENNGQQPENNTVPDPDNGQSDNHGESSSPPGPDGEDPGNEQGKGMPDSLPNQNKGN